MLYYYLERDEFGLIRIVYYNLMYFRAYEGLHLTLIAENTLLSLQNVILSKL